MVMIATLKCVNAVELSVQNSSAPVVISSRRPNIDSARVEIVTPNTVPYLWGLVVHAETTNLTVRWTGFRDPLGLDHYTARVLDQSVVVGMWTGINDYAIIPHLRLQDGREYMVEVTETNQ